MCIKKYSQILKRFLKKILIVVGRRGLVVFASDCGPKGRMFESRQLPLLFDGELTNLTWRVNSFETNEEWHRERRKTKDEKNRQSPTSSSERNVWMASRQL